MESDGRTVDAVYALSQNIIVRLEALQYAVDRLADAIDQIANEVSSTPCGESQAKPSEARD
jgi:hypothetical protein